MSQFPAGPWKKGAKRVEIKGLDDKRQINAVFEATITGEFLQSSLYTKVKVLGVTQK